MLQSREGSSGQFVQVSDAASSWEAAGRRERLPFYGKELSREQQTSIESFLKECKFVNRIFFISSNGLAVRRESDVFWETSLN